MKHQRQVTCIQLHWSHSCVLTEIALDHSKHGIPNLERQISQSPALFIQAVAWTYKRSDGGEDPHEWQIDDPEKHSDIAAATYRLLDKISRIPGNGRRRRHDQRRGA
jgi:hypothetical protein